MQYHQQVLKWYLHFPSTLPSAASLSPPPPPVPAISLKQTGQKEQKRNFFRRISRRWQQRVPEIMRLVPAVLFLITILERAESQYSFPPPLVLLQTSAAVLKHDWSHRYCEVLLVLSPWKRVIRALDLDWVAGWLRQRVCVAFRTSSVLYTLRQLLTVASSPSLVSRSVNTGQGLLVPETGAK